MPRFYLLLFAAISLFQFQNMEAREYFKEMNAYEKGNIEYIITTLANHSMISLIRYQPKLKKAGGEIESVHPLKLLSYVYQNPKLRRELPKIGRIPWSRFTADMAKSIEKESRSGNITSEHLRDFSQQVGVSEPFLIPYFKNRNWVPMMNALREHQSN